MKRPLLLLALLSIPALASAQEAPDSETWTTYCDGAGVERVRVTLVFHFTFPPMWYEGGELFPCGVTSDQCWPDDQGVMTPIGNGDYAVVWQGWLRECVPDPVMREGVVVFRFQQEYDTLAHIVPLRCSDGPQPIIDTIECAPLPVTSATWGAIKAQYRLKGDKP